jgi:hypothetical protein
VSVNTLNKGDIMTGKDSAIFIRISDCSSKELNNSNISDF